MSLFSRPRLWAAGGLMVLAPAWGMTAEPPYQVVEDSSSSYQASSTSGCRSCRPKSGPSSRRGSSARRTSARRVQYSHKTTQPVHGPVGPALPVPPPAGSPYPSGCSHCAGGQPHSHHSRSGHSASGHKRTSGQSAAKGHSAAQSNGQASKRSDKFVDEQQYSNPPTLWERLQYKWKNYWKPQWQETHWGYPEEFCEKPLGYWVHAHNRTMVANAEAVRMTLYDYDFEENSAELTWRGQEQLARIAYMLPRNFFPLVVQSTPIDPELAAARREKVVKLLAASNFPIPPERIIVASPGTYAREGYEAEPGQALLLQILTTGGAEQPFNTIIERLQGSLGGG